MAKVREIPWPEEFQDLKRIEEFMVCGICYEYIDTSVMTPCSHNYCSVCIRKYLHYKTQCPACFHDFFEKDLYINRAMDGLIRHYLQVREKILSLIENRSVYNSVKQLEQEQPSTPPVRPARSSQLPRSPKTVVEIKQVEPTVLNVINSPVASTSKVDMSSPTTSRSPKVQIPSIAKIFSTPKRKEIIAPVVVSVANAKTVMCPVCSVNISEQHVNVHLDACLKRATGQGAVKKKIPKRPPLPKLVLHVMKESELRKKMKEFGLSTIGDRRTLESRFTRYSVIYNAECDKPEPRPAAELIRQCEMEEKQERKMDSFLVAKNTENRLQIEKNAKEDKIEEAQKNYRAVNKSSFDKLIEEVRQRRKMEKESKEKEKQQNNETASSSSEPSTSVDPKSTDSVPESNDNAAYVPPAETAFQDSDSEDECPLQLYRSDNTVKSISVNLDDSSSCASVPNTPVKRPQKGKSRVGAKTKKSTKTPEAKSTNVYQMETDDDSMDDAVLSSPEVKKNQNHKRVRLSDKFINKSFVVETPEVRNEVVDGDDDTDYLDEQDIREAAARDVCKSIINDFSFESDDSASEFADNKRKTSKKKCAEKVKVDKNKKETISKFLNKSKLPEKANSSDQKDVKRGVAYVTLNNQVQSISLYDIPPEIFSEDNFKGFENSSIANIKTAQEPNPNEKEEIFPGKENNAFSANESSQHSATDKSINRPTRKRNPPMRFTEDAPTRRVTRAKTPSDAAPTSLHDVDSPKSTTSEGGSLKRRRGRAKTHSVEQPIDELQNPPKRPVRRRQAVSDPLSC